MSEPRRAQTERELYELTELYCPLCGKQDVWVETGPGDYYEGPQHACADCGASFTIPTCNTYGQEAFTDREVDALREQLKKDGDA